MLHSTSVLRFGHAAETTTLLATQ